MKSTIPGNIPINLSAVRPCVLQQRFDFRDFLFQLLARAPSARFCDLELVPVEPPLRCHLMNWRTGFNCLFASEDLLSKQPDRAAFRASLFVLNASQQIACLFRNAFNKLLGATHQSASLPLAEKNQQLYGIGTNDWPKVQATFSCFNFEWFIESGIKVLLLKLLCLSIKFFIFPNDRHDYHI